MTIDLLARRMHDAADPGWPWHWLPAEQQEAYREQARAALEFIAERVDHIGALVAATDHFNASGPVQISDQQGLQVSAALSGAWAYVANGDDVDRAEIEQIHGQKRKTG